MNNIACIERKSIPHQFLAKFIAIKTNTDTINNLFDNITFKEKNFIENNENFKQPIPYIVLTNKQNKIAIYQRNGSEKRLNNYWSIGFGGHIEPSDFSENNFLETLLNCAKREIFEELKIHLPDTIQFRGIINEEITPVGRTHIGFVFQTTINTIDTLKYSGEIKNLKFTTSNEIRSKNLELWSELTLKLIN
ncbi:MAG: hypothetical protein KatS3mg034_2081 [Vicingaceae bacterium]|nr:MAG: hypothetical protein KatS3mg034_2081 [Vicingaceae bacterium]